MTDMTKIAVITSGLAVVGTCVTLATKILKTNKTLKGIKEQLDILDALIEEAEKLKLQDEETH